jgi:hypothetical protein
LPTAQFGLAATSHSVSDEGAFILSHRASDLEQELIVRILTHRPVQELDLTAPLGEFVDEEHLMDIVTCQPVGSGHEHQVKGGQGRAIPQPIQTRPVEFGPTIAVIAVDMFLRKMPVGPRREVLAKADQLLFNGLRLLLSGGRDTDIQSHFHGTPPAGVMAQDTCLRGHPSPIAEGTDRHHPTAVHRHAVRSPCGVSAKAFSWVPPASSQYGTQKDTLAIGLVPQPVGATPPGQLECAPPGTAEFVI